MTCNVRVGGALLAIGWLCWLAGCRDALGLADRTPDANIDGDSPPCPTYYADNDFDGAGDPDEPIIACYRPLYAADAGDDCDDADRYRAPGLVETCDGLDNDCDPATPDGCAQDCRALPRRPPPNDTVAYIHCTTASTWPSARFSCQSWGFHLVYIETDPEQVYVEAQLNNNASWLGATDELVDRQWVWGNGVMFSMNGVTLTYARWNLGQPNNTGGEDCLAMQNSGWHDLDCTWTLGFVCER